MALYLVSLNIRQRSAQVKDEPFVMHVSDLQFYGGKTLWEWNPVDVS